MSQPLNFQYHSYIAYMVIKKQSVKLYWSDENIYPKVMPKFLPPPITPSHFTSFLSVN